MAVYSSTMSTTSPQLRSHCERGSMTPGRNVTACFLFDEAKRLPPLPVAVPVTLPVSTADDPTSDPPVLPNAGSLLLRPTSQRSHSSTLRPETLLPSPEALLSTEAVPTGEFLAGLCPPEAVSASAVTRPPPVAAPLSSSSTWAREALSLRELSSTELSPSLSPGDAARFPVRARVGGCATVE